MINLIIIGIIFLLSLIFSFIAYLGHLFYIPKNTKTDEGDKKIEQKNAPWQWKFFELWRFFVSFFLGGLIGYYFISVRWNPIFEGEALNAADFILIFIFILCITGLFPYLLKNITEEINATISRFLRNQ